MNEIKVYNFSTVDLPSFQHRRINGNEIVQFGDNNLYPEYILDLYNTSSMHNAIIENKSKSISGIGIKVEGEDNLNTGEKIIVDDILNKVSFDCDLQELVRRISKDWCLMGSFALEIIWNKSRNAIAQINHIDVSKVRISEMVEGKILNYYYSQDWKNRKIKPTQIQTYNPLTARKYPRQLLYVKEYRTGNDYYALPGYISAINWISLDAEISKFHLSNIQNGFTPSLLISFNNGVPTPEEMDVINDQLEKKYSGSKNAGKLMLTFNESKDKAPDIKVLETSNLDKQFIQLNESVLQNIISAHKVTSPLLMGIKTAGELGGSNELEIAFKIFENNVIKPERLLIEQTLNKLLAKFKTPVKIEIVPNSFDISFSEATLLSILSIDEMRAKIGYEPVSKNNDNIQ